MTIFTLRDVLFLFAGYPYLTIRCGIAIEFCGLIRDVPDCLLDREVLYLYALGEHRIEIGL